MPTTLTEWRWPNYPLSIQSRMPKSRKTGIWANKNSQGAPMRGSKMSLGTRRKILVRWKWLREAKMITELQTMIKSVMSVNHSIIQRANRKMKMRASTTLTTRTNTMRMTRTRRNLPRYVARKSEPLPREQPPKSAANASAISRTGRVSRARRVGRGSLTSRYRCSRQNLNATIIGAPPTWQC